MVGNSSSEWEHWYNLGKCSEAAQDYGVVDAKKMEVTLDVGQQCMLLFKFQSYREPIVDNTPVEEGAGTHWKSVEDPNNELKPRQIKVEILAKGFPMQ